MQESGGKVAVATREVPPWWRAYVVLRVAVFFVHFGAPGNKELKVQNLRLQRRVAPQHKKEPRWIMRVETPDANSWTWRRMCLRKASLDHRPTSMIVYVGTSFRHIAIAAPLRMECDPNSEGDGSQPRTSSLQSLWPTLSDLVNYSGGRNVF